MKLPTKRPYLSIVSPGPSASITSGRTGTEVAWSLGKIPDKRSIQPLYDLDRKLEAMRDPENVPLRKLKEAVFWAIKQCDTWDSIAN